MAKVMQGGSALAQRISRLPGGGPPNSCQCRNDDDLTTRLNIPAPNGDKRTVCIVFDELDPIAALEKSYDLSAEFASRETIFVQHTGTQTDSITFTNSIIILEQNSLEDEDGRSELYPNVATQTSYREMMMTTINGNEKQETPSSTVKRDSTKSSANFQMYDKSEILNRPIKKTDVKLKETPVVSSKLRGIGSNHPNFLLNKGFWRRSLVSEYPKITVNSTKTEEDKIIELQTREMQTQCELEQDDKICKKCEFIPMLGSELSLLRYKLQRLEAHVDHLQESINVLNKEQDIKDHGQKQSEMKPNNKDSSGLVVICTASNSPVSVQNRTGLDIFRIPKQPHLETSSSITKRELNRFASIPNPDSQKESASTESFKPCTCNQIKSNGYSYCKSVATQVGQRSPILSSENELEVQPNFDHQLERQPSSVCQFCSGKEQSVSNDLTCELLQLIEKRPFKDIMLSILLRADNVYHVKVQLLESNRVLGCFLVSHAAIEEAITQGIFKEILTYSIIDVRNTIKPIGRPFGIPFEFVAKPRETLQNAAGTARSVKSQDRGIDQFITNVLGLRADELKKNPKKMNLIACGEE
ncbi:uncharacterized protein LOC6566653 [Drosophila grimshawi]|uniref:GH13134 n=1 Tax=Drosophila grimshawi TaxID=7222 RepID=B4JQR2_DROGR|nr:uncharacterized protein LOC6566653 [Drosophila grimshawi]XP_032595531.1 uncharacterized protein LOC6566653 [Drosophila grimshawi]EDV99242.1 GH13134 [Drosophila grimshawi]